MYHILCRYVSHTFNADVTLASHSRLAYVLLTSRSRHAHFWPRLAGISLASRWRHPYVSWPKMVYYTCVRRCKRMHDLAANNNLASQWIWRTRLAIYFTIHLPSNTILFYMCSYVYGIAGPLYLNGPDLVGQKGVADYYSVSGPPFSFFSDLGAAGLGRLTVDRYEKSCLLFFVE